MNTESVNNKTANKKEKYDLIRQIGKTTYRVNAHFNKIGKETMSDKIIRMLQNDVKIPKTQGFLEAN